MRGVLLVAVAVLAIGAVSCGKKRQEPGSGSPPDTVATPSDGGDVPRSRVDLASDPMLRAMAPRLGDWVGRWRTLIPGFTLDSLDFDSIHFALGYRRAVTSEDLVRARLFGETSPDSTRIVEPDIYRQKVGASWELHGEPDSAPAILDLRDDSLTVVTVSGPDGGFEDAFWIDRDHIVLVAYGERRFEPWAGGGDLLVLDMPRQSLTYYHTPDVTKDAFERYRKLSDAAIRRRLGIPAL